MAWNWYVFLGIPYEIRFDGPHRLSFLSLRNTRTVSAEELQSIEPIRGGSGFYMLRYDGGRIRLLSQFTGFHEVISKMKAANPNFKVVGI